MIFRRNAYKKLLHLISPPLLTKLFRSDRHSREIRRIENQPRFKRGTSTVLGKKIQYTDGASFRFIYEEIFRKNIYQFSSHSVSPYIIDAGANIGLATIYFKLLYPQSTVIAFEPDAAVFQALKYNVDSFDLTNVELVNKGLWDDNTTLDFFSEGADGGRVAITSDTKQITTIETVRLIPYLDRRVDFLKIDVEGAEVRIMKDCRDHLQEVDNIFVEYHSFASSPQQLQVLLEILSDAGFRYIIQHIGVVSQQPFVEVKQYIGMDFQLNIYGYRP